MTKSIYKPTSASKKKTIQVYVDYAASVNPNPSSIHKLGIEAKNKLETARKDTATVFGVRKDEIIFTSGGTESNNLAIQGVVWAWYEENKKTKNTKMSLPHIITSNIEHPSVLETCKMLQKRKLVDVSIVPVESNGIVNPKKIKKEIKSNTVLISIMYVNNEIGTIQPIREIAQEIRYFKKNHNKGQTLVKYPLFHTDAVQAVNYLELNVSKLGVDMFSVSGAKINSAGRVGVLYKNKMINISNIYGGGDQEQGIRPGTENLSEILKFSLALKQIQKIKEKEIKRLSLLRDYFIKLLNKTNVDFLVNGEFKNKLQTINKLSHIDILPSILNISFPNIPSDLLVIELSAHGIMASAKSACKSGDSGGSYVISALRPHSSSEIGGVRFSFGESTTKNDINYTVKALSEILKKLKKWYN